MEGDETAIQHFSAFWNISRVGKSQIIYTNKIKFLSGIAAAGCTDFQYFSTF
jgi:hypothetical protein